MFFFLNIPEHCPFKVQTELIRIIFYTFSPSLPVPTRTSHPCHHHILQADTQSSPLLRSTCPNTSIYTTPHHLSHALNTQKTVQDLTSLPILQSHTTHDTSISPSYALLSPGSANSQPSLPMSQSHICQHTLDTGHTNLGTQFHNIKPLSLDDAKSVVSITI